MLNMQPMGKDYRDRIGARTAGDLKELKAMPTVTVRAHGAIELQRRR